MIFKKRTTAPDPGDPAYTGTKFGGKNRALVINKKNGFVLPNCCGEVHGRWIECGGHDNLCIGDAHSYWGYTKDGHARSNKPHVGAIVCWEGGSKGKGHVAFIEEMGHDKKGDWILTSNSGYKAVRTFWTKKIYGPKYQYSAKYKLQGFILGEYNYQDPEFFTYKIVRGDTLSEIAKKYHTSVSIIMKDNPYIKDPDKIYAGKTLQLRR